MPVGEDDGKGGKRRTNRARKERKGTPQGSPISPLLSNIYMRRFVLGWKTLGHARHFCAEIVNYADGLCVLGKAPAAEMLTAVKRTMDGLKLTVNEQKTRCLRCPEEPLEFLGYAGTRGCKVTLIAAAAPGPLVDEPRFFEQGGRTAYGWRVGQVGYLLVAEGMARERLDLIADSVRRASLERLPLNEETRTALMQNRRDSKPCLA